jgi:transcription elongation GreA/GreB family factor
MTPPDRPNSALLLTRADYEQSRAHLDELRRVRDRDLPALLRDARGFVASDAEEEIAQIRDDHVFVEARIDVAVPGRVVDVEYTRSGKQATYRIASPGSGVRAGTVSAGSPVGQGLIGRGRGDRVSVELPNGRTEELRIVAVRRDDEALAAA